MKQIVKADRLCPDPADPANRIEVGSEEWFNWLAQHDQFIYQGETDRFTARREIRRGSYYWYGYRKRAGKLHKIYLGRAADLTPAKLRQANATGFDAKAALQTAPGLGSLLNTAVTFKDKAAVSTPFALSPRLIPPTLPANLIDRPRLTQQINTPITLITAPTGFGKTTLLNQWRSERLRGEGGGMNLSSLQPSALTPQPFSVAWVSLETAEDNVYSFWLMITSALQQFDPALGETISIQLQSLTPPPIEPIITDLSQNLNRWQADRPDRRLALIIDNYQRARAPEIAATCQLFLDRLPPAMQVIVASQELFPFAVPRWRGQGIVTELTQADLRLTPEEGVAWLDRILTVPLTPREKLALVMRVEGWSAGLNLLALALKKQEDVHRFVVTFEGHHPYLQEYFVEEILKKYPAEWQTFLLQSSILKILNASLCQAVTEQADSEQILAQLHRANQFVALVDPAQGGYQYQDLFAQALQAQLRQQFPQQDAALHQRAADWYQTHGLYSEALHHLVQVGAWSQAAQLIDRVILDELRRGIDHRVLKWLQQLPDELFVQHDTLLFTYVRLAMPSLPRQQIEGLLNRLAARLEAQPPTALSAKEQRLLSQLSAWKQTGAIPAPEASADPVDEIESLRTMLALMYQAFCLQQQGEITAGETTLWQAFELGKARGVLFIAMVAGGRLAMRLAEHGRLRQSEALARDILQWALTQTGSLPLSASVPLTALGRIHYARNQIGQARQFIDEAVLLDPHPTSVNTIIHHQGLLAYILYQQGNRTAAHEALQATLKLGSTGEFPLPALKAHQAMLFLRDGDGSTAEQILREVSNAPLPATQTKDGLLKTAWAEFFLAQQRYPEAEAMLTGMAESTPDPILSFLPYPTLLLALAYWGQHQVNQAMQALLEAIRMAEPEGIIRPFLDCGSALMPLLTVIQATQKLGRPQRHFVSQLLSQLQAIYPDAPVPSPSELAVSTLSAQISPREQEILRLLNEGLDNKELAQRLMVSPNTISSHLRNIYDKLGVNSRIQAVKRARELQLV